MSIKQMKCENCGSNLEYNEKNQLVCENCGSLYSERQEIKKNYINNTVIKNFYGNDSNQAEIANEKINGLIFQAVNNIKDANYSDARKYCVSVLS